MLTDFDVRRHAIALAARTFLKSVYASPVSALVFLVFRLRPIFGAEDREAWP